MTNSDLTGGVGKLAGITNSELTGALGKLSEVSGAHLGEAVGAVAVVKSLCQQAEVLTGGVNGVLGITVLGLVGLSLNTTGLPAALPSYVCPG